MFASRQGTKSQNTSFAGYISVMFAKPRPVLASFIAAGVALLPILIMAVSELMATPSGISTAGEPDDAGFRGAALAFAAMPFLYIAAVPVCYAVGVLLVTLRLRRLTSFLAGTVAVAFLLGLIFGVFIGVPSQFGLSDLAASIAVSTLLFLITALPAAACWWFLAVRPHNPPLNPDSP